MLLVRTRLAQSSIHGLGVFTEEDIAAGRALWRFEPGLDLVIPFEKIEALPAAFRAFLDTYAYPSPDAPGGIVLSCDNAKYLNHSEEPNTDIRGTVTLARRAIAAGEEITCDYRDCVVGWPGFA